MEKCSYCGRENQDGSTQCSDCGTLLIEEDHETIASQDAARGNSRCARGEKLMRQGMMWFIGGVAVTLFSYLAAIQSPYGGHYVIAYGAIVVGVAQYFRGRAAASGTDTAERARELLDMAAQLESVDRARAVALYATIVKDFPGTRASNEAQRNMQILTSGK